MSKVLSVRVDDELAAEVERVAGERGVKRAVVLEEAVRRYFSLVVSATAGPALRGPVRVDTVTDAARWARERQARLNKAKDRSK